MHLMAENYCTLIEHSGFVLTSIGLILSGKLGSSATASEESIVSNEQHEHSHASFDSEEMFNGT
jgi:hypothetical protein